MRGLREHGDPIEKNRLLANLEGRLFARAPGPLRLARYELGERLGAGAMGIVYRAFDPALGRDVALKLIHTGRSTKAAQKARERLRREAQALARLSHPNIVRIYDVGVCDEAQMLALERGSNGGGLYVVMELVEGRTLDRWIRKANPPVSDIVAALVGAGRGLVAAHAAGVVHRDFKPANVMMGEDGRVRVLDFGLSRTFGPDPSSEIATVVDRAARTLTESELPTSLTRTGEVAGTPAYMAPEVFRERRSDFATDQFSFCVAMYECLYGQRPFSASSVEELIEAVEHHRVEPAPQRPEIRSELRKVLLRGLSPDPAHRYPSVGHLLEALERAVGGGSRRAWWFGSSCVAICGALVAWMAQPMVELGACASSGPEELWSAERVEGAATAWKDHEVLWSRIARELDTRADAWTTARAEACAPATPVEVRELALQCLEKRRRELVAALDFVVEPSPQGVARGLDVVVALPSVERCSEGALHRPMPSPPPVEQLDRVAALRLRLATFRFEVEAHGLESARLQELDALVSEVDATGYAPLRAEAMLVHALASRRRGASEEAAVELEQAYLAAESSSDFETALDAASELVAVHGVDLEDPSRASRWIQHAQATLERGSWSPDTQPALALRGQIAAVQAEQGETAEAMRSYTELLDDARRSLGSRHPMVASLLNNLANLHDLAGTDELARTQYEAALEIERELRGDRHPRVASILDNLANLWDQRGDLERALQMRIEASRIRERTLGTEHVAVARSAMNLGMTYMRMSRLDDAAAALQRALETLSADEGAHRPEILRVRSTLAAVWAAGGRNAEARAEYERVHRLAQMLGSAAATEAIAAWAGEGSLLSRSGEHDRALEAYAEAIELAREAYGPEHPEVAMLLRHRGVAHRRAGQLDRALHDLRAALAIALSREGELPTLRASIHHGLGDVLRMQRRPEAAARQYREALAMRTSAPGLPGEQALSQEGLAHALAEAGRATQARTEGRRAIELYAEAGLVEDAERVSSWTERL